MDTKHVDLIRTSYGKLADAIKSRVDDVTKSLWQRKIISENMEEDILEGHNTGRKRSTALLDLIPTRGRYAFGALYEAVLEAELFEAADILKPNCAPHQVQKPRKVEIRKLTPSVKSALHGGDDSSDDELPDMWPSQEAMKVKLRKIEDWDIKQLKLFEKSQTPGGQKSYYTMQQKTRGLALVIDQEKFVNFPQREGTQKDKEGISNLFQGLGFKVTLRENLTAEQMWTAFEQQSQKEHDNYDCFVLFIMSHGENGIVFGTDGKRGKPGKETSNCIKIKDITDLFCSVESLKTKPKLFFIQACQGSDKDYGYDALGDAEQPKKTTGLGVSNSKHPECLPAFDFVKASDRGEDKAIQDTQRNLKEVVSAEDSDWFGDNYSYHHDLFVAMATTPGSVSWRNIVHGTWFIQAIIYIFSKYSYKYDLNKLMLMTNQLVSMAEASKEKYKQIGEKKDTFQKTFYFFTGKHI